MRRIGIFVCGFVFLWSVAAYAGQDDRTQVEINGREFDLPAGFNIELVTNSSLVERPIHAAFDFHGRLYVTESNGTNDPVAQQLEQRPHRVVRLEDTDGDGSYDSQIVFADQLMFPEGALWYDGALYVSAPPEIWKFEDRDDDGYAEHREVWFDGKTLTGCANDLHGPYLGRDGWIYWCKGAFAEQTYVKADGTEWTTRAAHIFRQRPEGSLIESVMAGGMDNPVEVVVTHTGERIFNTTFLQHPSGGLRDGLIHAIYGGVYGKRHSVLDGHPRTGELMPPLVHLGAAAPSGLLLYESDQFGDDYNQNIFATLFNMHKVTRHRLEPHQGSYRTEDHDFVVCNDLDFHPTDILEDADGSLLIVDTGGWYKLCCPTSQLWKPDVIGGIYRVRKIDATTPDDPLGEQIEWSNETPQDWVVRVDDSRPVVRERAMQALAKAELSDEVYESLRNSLITGSLSRRVQTVWALCRINDRRARSLNRMAIEDPSDQVAQAAMHSASVWRDQESFEMLIRQLQSEHLHCRRVAAEALGRLGNRDAVGFIIDAIEPDLPRVVEHSLIYALIELDAEEELYKRLAVANASQQYSVLLALDQIGSKVVQPSELIEYLQSSDRSVAELAWAMLGRSENNTAYIQTALSESLDANLSFPIDDGNREVFEIARNRFSEHFGNLEIRQLLIRSWNERQDSGLDVSHFVSAVLRQVSPSDLGSDWGSPIRQFLQSDDTFLQDNALMVLANLDDPGRFSDVRSGISELAHSDEASTSQRILALRVLLRFEGRLDDHSARFLCSLIGKERSPVHRTTAMDVIEQAFDSSLATPIIEALPLLGPAELSRCTQLLVEHARSSLGDGLTEFVAANPSATSLDPTVLEELLTDSDGTRSEQAKELIEAAAQIDTVRLERIHRVMSLIDDADSRNGQRIFQSDKAACASCHAVGYLGGRIGPDLTRIGGIRSDQDLLESIIFPNATFVRSYEPYSVLTLDGIVYNGILRDETDEHIELVIDQEKVVTIAIDDIDIRQAGNVSVMPSGIDQQLTDQELADLVKFLRTAR